MGAMATAACQCGYSAQLFLGGGMSNCETFCAFPVYCRSCRTMTEINLINSPMVCECGALVVPYDDASINGDPSGNEVFSWHVEEEIGRELILNDGGYLCPACQKMTLKFERTGHWD